jgi:hypothetical protein
MSEPKVQIEDFEDLADHLWYLAVQIDATQQDVNTAKEESSPENLELARIDLEKLVEELLLVAAAASKLQF